MSVTRDNAEPPGAQDSRCSGSALAVRAARRGLREQRGEAYASSVPRRTRASGAPPGSACLDSASLGGMPLHDALVGPRALAFPREPDGIERLAHLGLCGERRALVVRLLS